MKSKSLNLINGAVALTAGLALFTYTAPVLAKGGGHGGGGGANGGGSGVISFAVTLDDSAGYAVQSDGGGAYVDGSQKVMAEGQDGGGLRIDTNGGSQKLEGAGTTRMLRLDFSNVDPSIRPFVSELRGVDFRMALDLPAPDWFNLPVGSSLRWGCNLRFLETSGDEQSTVGLYYGNDTPPNGPQDLANAPLITHVNATTWTIEGDKACWKLQDNDPCIASVSMPFKMTLVAQ